MLVVFVLVLFVLVVFVLVVLANLKVVLELALVVAICTCGVPEELG